MNACFCYYTRLNGWDIDTKIELSTALTRAITLDPACPPGKPCHVYATVPEDTATSAFINIHVHYDVTDITFKYDTVVYYEAEKEYREDAKSVHKQLTFDTVGSRTVHSVLLTELTPDTLYKFEIVYDKKTQYTGVYKTLPDATSTKTISVVLGGDVGTTSTAQKMTENLKGQKPDIVFIGGDVAYDNGMWNCWYTWDLFFEPFETLNKDLGYHVPLVLGVGNHDVGFHSHSEKLDDKLPLFFYYFPQHVDESGPAIVPAVEDRKSYFYHKVGNAIFLGLDSDYVVTSKGKQTDFMKKISEAHPTAGKFAYYHVPTYTACTEGTDEDTIWVEESKKNWTPLFDEYSFDGVFENHVHMLKRTLPLKNGKHDEDGTVYYGDGNWGVEATVCSDAKYSGNVTGLFDAWGSENHVWTLHFDKDSYEVFPIDVNGDRLHHSTTGTF